MSRMSGPKKKAVKKQVRKVEEDLGIDPESLFGGALIAGIASLFDDDDEDEEESDNDSIFDSDDSDDSDDDSGDFGDGDSGGGGSSSDW